MATDSLRTVAGTLAGSPDQGPDIPLDCTDYKKCSRCLVTISSVARAEAPYQRLISGSSKTALEHQLFYVGARTGSADVEIDDEMCYPGITGGAAGFTVAAVNVSSVDAFVGVEQDPHLHFAHGGRADFRGRHGQIYTFFSAPGLAVNLKTENATFPLDRKLDGSAPLIVHGSFVTEMHLVALVGGSKRKWANVSFWASSLGENNWGWDVVTGTCGGHRFKLGKGGQKGCEQLMIKVDMSRASFTAGNLTVEVAGAPTQARKGPEHRLDVSFTLRGDYVQRNLPHGDYLLTARPLPSRAESKARASSCRHLWPVLLLPGAEKRQD